MQWFHTASLKWHSEESAVIRNRLLLYTWIGILLAPFATAILLAFGSAGGQGSNRISLSVVTGMSNFSTVIVGARGEEPEFVASFGNSLVVAIVASLFAVCPALPVAQKLGSKWRPWLWTVATICVGARVVPVTAPLPIFFWLARSAHVNNSVTLLIVLYILLFFPLACALLSTAEWGKISEGRQVLEMDADLTRWERLKHYYRTLLPDIGLAMGVVFLMCWSDFVVASFFLPAGKITISNLLLKNQTYYGTSWGRLGAAIILSGIPVALIVLVGDFALRRRATLAYE